MKDFEKRYKKLKQEMAQLDRELTRDCTKMIGKIDKFLKSIPSSETTGQDWFDLKHKHKLFKTVSWAGQDWLDLEHKLFTNVWMNKGVAFCVKNFNGWWQGVKVSSLDLASKVILHKLLQKKSETL